MGYTGTGRAMPLAAPNSFFSKVIAMTILLTMAICTVIPIEVLAYTQDMSEIVVLGDPGLIVQNQSYSTRTRQSLFHSAVADGSDTESFALSGSPLTGVQLAQAASAIASGSETGFFTSTATSDIVPPVHIGNGFLGTSIGDPLRSQKPIYAGLMFPRMSRVDPVLIPSPPKGLAPAGSTTALKSGATGNETKNDLVMFQPVIKDSLNDVMANERTINVTTTVKDANENTPSKTATNKVDVTPSPVIRPGQVFYHQQNKPFSTAITAPAGPFKATPAKVQNMSDFDRFLMNTVARSSMDKAFNGTTSSPAYITPDKALAAYVPYEFIQGARGMTMPGTHLNYRAWPL